MIPAPLLLVWRYRKLAGYVLAAAAIGLLAWRVLAWRAGYLERAAAVSELETEREGRATDRQGFAASLAASQAAREALQADFARIRGKFAALTVPPPKDLTTTEESPIAAGQTTCPVPRVSSQFVSVWNAQAAP
jgi:hypothetical protein